VCARSVRTGYAIHPTRCRVCTHGVRTKGMLPSVFERHDLTVAGAQLASHRARSSATVRICELESLLDSMSTLGRRQSTGLSLARGREHAGWDAGVVRQAGARRMTPARRSCSRKPSKSCAKRLAGTS